VLAWFRLGVRPVSVRFNTGVSSLQ